MWEIEEDINFFDGYYDECDEHNISKEIEEFDLAKELAK